MTTKSKIKQLEKKFISIKNSKGGGTIVIKYDEYGRWIDKDDHHLLTQSEVNNIKKERELFDKQLVLLNCWEPFKKLPKELRKSQVIYN
jgi:hypothetical protein